MVSGFSLIIEYVCKICNNQELHFEIIPKLKCPDCNCFYEVIEEADEAIPSK